MHKMMGIRTKTSNDSLNQDSESSGNSIDELLEAATVNKPKKNTKSGKNSYQ